MLILQKTIGFVNKLRHQVLTDSQWFFSGDLVIYTRFDCRVQYFCLSKVYHTLILIIFIGKAPGMPKVRKSCFTTTCVHTIGDRVRHYWMGEVSYAIFL